MRCFYFILVLLIFSPFSVLAGPTELFVSVNGSDLWTGSLPDPDKASSDGPFATLERAKSEIRRLKSLDQLKSGCTVYVRGGRYELDHTFRLRINDGGSSEGPITYKSYNNEKVVISGGRNLFGSKIKNGIVQYVLPGDLKPGFDVLQLFCDGERMVPARWPNRSGKGVDADSWAFTGYGPGENSQETFNFDFSARGKNWGEIENSQISIFPNYTWYHAVSNIFFLDKSGGQVHLATPVKYGVKPGRRFYFSHVFEELDTPGEWFLSERNKTLYFYPPEKHAGKPVVLPVLDYVLRLDNVSHVKIEGLTFEAGIKDCVLVTGGSENRISNCTIRNTGGVGVVFKDGWMNGIESSCIYDTGKGGLYISGGDRDRLIPASHFAKNNHITRFGQINKFLSNACTVAGVGNLLKNNLIHDGPDIAIRLYGNDHIVEYNEIYDVCRELADTGAIYIGRDWTYRGNIIRFNKIHDVYGFGLTENLKQNQQGIFNYETPLRAWGIYIDDCASGTLVYGNVIYRVPLGGVIIGGGNDNYVENNIFIDCIPALHISARSEGLFASLEPGLHEKLIAKTGKDSPYLKKYPELEMLNDRDRRIPVNNRFIRNFVAYRSDDYSGKTSMKPVPGSAIVYDFQNVDRKTTGSGQNIFWHFSLPLRFKYSSYNEGNSIVRTMNQMKAQGYEIRSVISRPRYLAWGKKDYGITIRSSMFGNGFNPIPVSKIGIENSYYSSRCPVENFDWLKSMERKVYKIEIPMK